MVEEVKVMSKRSNKYLVDWRGEQITLRHYSIEGAQGCAFHNRMEEKFSVSPSEIMSYEDFLADPSLTIQEINNYQFKTVIGPVSHTGFFEWFDVFDRQGLLCFLVGPMIRRGEKINDNSNPVYERHFQTVEKSYPQVEIIAIKPFCPRIIMPNRQKLTAKAAKVLATCI